uniref:Uncharacterized protein n=1 Tax=Helicotheca tamesis TaxID=374047 RepID=A0A7S2H645_9STRA|mmetsp:Transcript_15557/g.21255  ORF Transcript_15557/g.21255 Transcript_15557/m.21255 type:complete len:267 (+) Transcript_15557:97-897(+)
MRKNQEVPVAEPSDIRENRVKFSASVDFSSKKTLICAREFRMLWYSPMSLARIGADNRRDVREGQRVVKKLSSDKSCTRGLEFLSDDDDRVGNMAKIRESTLEIYMKQKVNEERDSEKLAAAYIKLTALAKKQALERASIDEEEMKKICAKELKDLAKEKKSLTRKAKRTSKPKKNKHAQISSYVNNRKRIGEQQTSGAKELPEKEKQMLSISEDLNKSETNSEDEINKTDAILKSKKARGVKQLKKMIFFQYICNGQNRKRLSAA